MAVLLLAVSPVGFPAEAQEAEPVSRYPAIASEIAGLQMRDIRKERGFQTCHIGAFDPQPCALAVKQWKAWTDRHNLPQNSKSAAAFKAYVLRDFATGDRHYAELVGHTKAAYDQVARAVRGLGIRQHDGRKASCENHAFSANPCRDSLRLWKVWAAEQGLPLTYRSASIFEAYVEGDDARGHVQYALAKGHPVPESYVGPGTRVLALGLGSLGGREQEGCVNNYFAINPCPRAIHLWKRWAEREGLPLDYASAAAFQAYVNHDFRTGDRLYARAKGLPDPNAYAGPGLKVVALGLQPWDPIHRSKGKFLCRNNPFAHEPCGPDSRRAFERWAAANGVANDIASAAAFEAYTNYDFDRGDRLFAAVKGVSVEELLRDYQGEPPQAEPDKLIIDVYPIN